MARRLQSAVVMAHCKDFADAQGPPGREGRREVAADARPRRWRHGRLASRQRRSSTGKRGYGIGRQPNDIGLGRRRRPAVGAEIATVADFTGAGHRSGLSRRIYGLRTGGAVVLDI